MGEEILKWVDLPASGDNSRLYLNIGLFRRGYVANNHFILDFKLPLSESEAGILRMCYPHMTNCIDTLTGISDEHINWDSADFPPGQGVYRYKSVTNYNGCIEIDRFWK